MTGVMSDMMRQEIYCGGSLVKRISQVDVMDSMHAYHHYVDGRHIWLWEGEEVSEPEAQAFIQAYGQSGVDEAARRCHEAAGTDGQIQWGLDWITGTYGTGDAPCDGSAAGAATSTRPSPAPAGYAETAPPLTHDERRILGLIADQDHGWGVTAGWIADQINCSPPLAGRILSKLAARGLVRKGRMRTRQFWHLTDTGITQAPPQ